MGHRARRKEVEQILSKLQRQGWTISFTANTHMRCAPPDPDKPIVFGSHCEEPRALANFRATLRRSGADI
jgi:hypothetical protein